MCNRRAKKKKKKKSIAVTMCKDFDSLEYQPDTFTQVQHNIRNTKKQKS